MAFAVRWTPEADGTYRELMEAGIARIRSSLDRAVAKGKLAADDRDAAEALLDKQMVGYNYVVLRSVGDQPGVNYPRYLSDRWRTLPQGSYISPEKFVPATSVSRMQADRKSTCRICSLRVTNCSRRPAVAVSSCTS